MDSKISSSKNTNKKKDDFKIHNIVDETQLKAGSELIWLWWVAIIDSKNKHILALSISKERNTCLLQNDFCQTLLKNLESILYYYSINRDGGTWYPSQACQFLKLKHCLQSSYEKNLIERTMQYIKDRTESFDDYFPCSRKEKCNLFHIKNWFNLFVNMHNKEVLNA